MKDRADQYLRNLVGCLHVLEVVVLELNEAERLNLHNSLEANRFDEKYNGDKLATLRWAILEEQKWNVRMLVNKDLALKEKDKGKRIIPQLAFETPAEFASLVYDYQSLA